MATVATTPDGSKYIIMDLTTKSRSYLWVNSRLALASGFSWGSSNPTYTFSTAPLPQVQFDSYLTPIFANLDLTTVSDGGSQVITTSFASETGFAPAGVARTILSVDTSTGTPIYIPYHQVSVNDWNKARTLNHNFEPPPTSVPEDGELVYSDELEGAGHRGDKSGDEVFEIPIIRYNEDLSGNLNQLPVGLDVVKHADERWFVEGDPSHITATSVVVKQTQSNPVSGLTRSHWRRLSFSAVAEFAVASAVGTLELPTKLFFNADANQTLPTESLPSVYGMDQTTNPNGASNYISILGGTAPYTFTVKSITCFNALGGAVPIGSNPPIVSPGLSGEGLPQFHIGFTDDYLGTPVPLYQGQVLGGTYPDINSTTGSGWSFVMQSNRCYVKSIPQITQGSFNVGSFSLLPLTIKLGVSVVDSNGLAATGPSGEVGDLEFSIPLRLAPGVPQIVNPQTVLPTGSIYNMSMGYSSSSSTLHGYPFDQINAAGLFKTDVTWWRPSITPIWRGVWASSALYHLGDAVTFSGGSYKAIADSTGVSPDTSGNTVWTPLGSDPQYSFTLMCKEGLPQGGPVGPILFERFPTYVDPSNPSYYDYIQVSRKLSQFLVAGSLGISGPSVHSQVFAVGSPVSLSFQVSGGTPPYTWISDINSLGMTGLQGAASSLGNEFLIYGSRVAGSLEVFPQTKSVSITVKDSSTPFQLSSSTSILLTFTSPSSFSVFTEPFLASDFKFYSSHNSSVDLLTSRASFPWTNFAATGYDYVNDFSDGLIPGGAQIGYVSGVDSAYTVECVNLNPNLWSSFRYQLPMGLCFGVKAKSNGGYSPYQYYQIKDMLPGSGESLVQYSGISGEPVPTQQDNSLCILDSNNKPKGFRFSLQIKAGDILVGAMNRLGSATDQFWELGYMAPHFELQTGLATNPPLDADAALSIDDVSGKGCDLTKYSAFVSRLDSEYNTGAFGVSEDPIIRSHASPEIGAYSDTLQMTIKKDGYNSVVDAKLLPIHEDFTAKFWTAAADMWGNPSYYWLGSTSKFKTNIDPFSKTMFFGFTECDRILKTGAFPSRTSPLFPLIQSSFVNFHLTNADGTSHSRNLELHQNPLFITSLESYFKLLTGNMSELDGWRGGTLNLYMDYDTTTGKPGPLMDPAPYKYFKGPSVSGSKTPGSGSSISHPTLTEIDRGYRVVMSMDSLGLWTYLNSSQVGVISGQSTSQGAPLAAGTRLHIVWMFLLTRPNILLGDSDAQTHLDLDMLSKATGLTTAELSAKYLRGKSFTRVPLHLVIENGVSTLLQPPLIPTGPSVLFSAQ